MLKEKIFINFIIPVATTIIVAAIGLLYIFLWKIPSPEEVFYNAQNYVVELKSYTNEDLTSYGSAIIINSEGTIITNAHLVVYKNMGIYQLFDSFEVRFSFETEYRVVSLVKYDLNKDIAILKLDNFSAFNLQTPNIFDSSKIQSGDKVYAIGNGMNHGIGINQGIVSLPLVNINHNENTFCVVQCDLIINDGNSGGALLDEKGNLIGITSFRIKDNLGNPIYGVAFSIPINTVIEYINA